MERTDYRANREPLVPLGGVDHHVADMTATVSAAVPLGEFQAILAQHDHWVPIDGDLSQTVGTLVACDSTGPLRLGFGAWRDLLLGVQFRNGRGELITAGGRTVKNVAGYDLTKFMVGQRGIFGELVTVTTRTYRRPKGAVLARHAPDLSILNRLIPTSLRPQWAVLTKDALLCGYLGDLGTYEFYRDTVGTSEPAGLIDWTLREDAAYRANVWRAEGPVVFRASVPPAKVLEMVAHLPETPWVADAAFGVVLGSLQSAELNVYVSDAARAAGGTARFSDGAYGPLLEVSTTPAEKRIIERLKGAFDPDRRLKSLPWQSA